MIHHTKFYFFILALISSTIIRGQDVQTACFFYESKDLFERHDTTGCAVKFVVDNEMNRINYFKLTKIWNDKRQKFKNNNKNIYACKRDDELYWNLSKCNELNVIDWFIKYDILGMVSAVIIPEENFSDFPRDAFTGFGLIADVIVAEARASRGIAHDKDGNPYLMILIDREGEKKDYIEPRGKLITRKLLLDIAERHSAGIDFISNDR